MASRVRAFGRAAILAIRREDKSRWERRAPFAPQHVQKLINTGARVLVQPSSTRVFKDAEYAAVGAQISEDLSAADTILAVKEVPSKYLLPDRTYYFFSHTIKGQPHNMSMLDDILRKNIRLIDYERIVDDNNARLVKFGRFAGCAGMIDAFTALGDRLLVLGHSTPFLHVTYSKTYPSLDAAKAALRTVGQLISQQGIPEALHPMSFVFTGDGAVTKGAREVFEQLPHKWVTPEELKALCESKGGDRNVVYAAQIKADKMVARKTDGGFDKAEYYAKPSLYKPTFATNIAPYTSVLVNCMYWERQYAKLLTGPELNTLQQSGNSKLTVVSDITCDLNGSIEFNKKNCTIDTPFYLYNAGTDAMSESMYAPGVVTMTTDNLPAELPRDATESFGDQLLPHVLATVTGDKLPTPLARAVVTESGKLTPAYAYISELGEKNRPRRVLMLGTGLVAPPAVDFLHKQGYHVTVASDDLKQAEGMVRGRDSIKPAKIDVSDSRALTDAIAAHDIVISLVPAVLHPKIAAAAVAARRSMVTASYTSPALAELNDAAKKADVAIFNEAGLDPGIDHLSAMEHIHDIQAKGGYVEEFTSWCGGLPAPEFADNPLGYKFSWSPRGVLNAAKASAKFIADGRVHENASALKLVQPIDLWRGFNLEGYPNRDSAVYADAYGIPDAKKVLRGTLRYSGYAEVVSTMNTFGLLEETPLNATSWFDLMKTLTKSSDPKSAVQSASVNAANAFEWLGLFDRQQRPTGANVIDALCRHLQQKLALGRGEADLVLLHHTLIVRWKDGSRERRLLSLVEYGERGGVTAMARTVGIPCAIGAHLLLNGTIQRKGVFAPMTPDIYKPMLKILGGEGIHMKEIIEKI